MVKIKKYNTDFAALWDNFVRTSRNGTFLFVRAYMDYHSDRFTDHSLLFFDDDDRLVALLPANEAGSTLHSHQGLTYGGFILQPRAHSALVEELFRVTLDYLRRHGFSRWIYKQVPHIYHTVPSEEEEYFLWRMGATMCVCNLGCAIMLSGDATLPLQPRKARAIRKLQRDGVRLTMNAPLDTFWPLLTQHLGCKYGAAPVHTLQEMQLLQQRFPDNIVCATLHAADGELLAGAVAYDMGHVVHLQYSSVSDRGQRLGAQEYVDYAFFQHYRERPTLRYFDFGTSNEDGGRVLNASLIHFKECFGARGVAYKQWEIEVSER